MVVKSARSGKTKGQEFQKWVVRQLRLNYCLDRDESSCFDGDVQAQPMGQSGVDVKLSPHARQLIPFDIECKRAEKWNVHEWWSQTETNAKAVPLLVMKRNHKEPLALIKFEDLLDLMVKNKEDKE